MNESDENETHKHKEKISDEGLYNGYAYHNDTAEPWEYFDGQLNDNFFINKKSLEKRLNRFGINAKARLEVFPELLSIERDEQELIVPSEEMLERLKQLNFGVVDVLDNFLDLVIDDPEEWRQRKGF